MICGVVESRDRRGAGRILTASLGIVGVAAFSGPAPLLAQDETATPLPEIRVIATTPLPAAPRRRPVARTAVPRSPAAPAAPPPPQTEGPPGFSDPTVIDRDKVPSSTQSLTAGDFQRNYSSSVTDTLSQRVPGVFTTDIQGNGFTQDLRYRGFAASPLQGTPQGLAVSMNGIRWNEAFGDTVNWDLIPTNAIERADVWSSNPIFGLNALGGAVSLQMKNGFGYQGLEAEFLGGSYGRLNGSLQYGAQKDNAAVYVAAQGLDEHGWRYQSPSQLGRIYGDLGWRSDQSEIHFIGAAARNFFGVIGPTPVEMLARDWKSIFTWPQTTQNEMSLAAFNGRFNVTDHWTLQSNLYVRRFHQKHVDGNDADVERCSGDPKNPLFNTLCLSAEGFSDLTRKELQILGPDGKPIRCRPGAGDQCAITPYGTIDRTQTRTTTVGGSLQLSGNDKIIGRDNNFTIGGSIDQSWIDFGATSELGRIFPDLFVGPDPDIPGTGEIIHTAANVGYGPVSLAARNTYFGVYMTDTFSITPRLAVTAGGRLNVAKIAMADQLGTSPELNNNITYERINPVGGVTYKLTPDVSMYGGYAESNRVPTPLELGCANPKRPCLLEGFLVADPPLKQVVGRTVEGGLRGERSFMDGRIEWKAGVFRTDSTNDIINVASVIPGRGVFQNVAATRRQGLEAGAQYTSPHWLVYANYSFTDATYQFAGDLSSPNNPRADEAGNIHVVPGNRIPMIPQHQLKVGADYAVTPEWKVGADLNVVGSQFYVGDDANQNDKLPAYWVANLHTSYQVRKDLQVFGIVRNLFNNKVPVYGTYFGLDSIVNAVANPPTDPRMQTPLQPLSVYAGVRVKW